nr:hypothetical protein [Micromonospora endophytica]
MELVAGKLKGPAAAISGGINRSVYELTLARADGELDAVELLLRRVAEVADRGDPGPVLTVRNGRDCALAADLLAGVVDRLIRSSGSRGRPRTSHCSGSGGTSPPVPVMPAFNSPRSPGPTRAGRTCCRPPRRGGSSRCPVPIAPARPPQPG